MFTTNFSYRILHYLSCAVCYMTRSMFSVSLGFMELRVSTETELFVLPGSSLAAVGWWGMLRIRPGCKTRCCCDLTLILLTKIDLTHSDRWRASALCFSFSFVCARRSDVCLFTVSNLCFSPQIFVGVGCICWLSLMLSVPVGWRVFLGLSRAYFKLCCACRTTVALFDL